ncbi:MAG: redoxin domain-containing protein [Candidatus Micrarchaeota archaeon]
MVKIGEEVPDMEVEVYQNNDTRRVKLSDYRGKWLVLVFYPADFTFVCPTELEELANAYGLFGQAGAEIMSVSTDTVYVHKAWHDTSPAVKKIRYPMAADPNHRLCKLFGTHIEEEGVSLRGTFIIDPDGVLMAMEIHDNSIGRSAREILRKVQAAKFVRENPGNVCPAAWEPGKETIKPGLNLVGKI